MIVSIHTHPIVRDMHEEYDMNWCGKIINTHPKIVNGKPLFIVTGARGRTELNTIDMDSIERAAKRMTEPHGRSAVSVDKAYIFIKEENGNEALMGILTHRHIKRYNQMFDKFEYI